MVGQALFLFADVQFLNIVNQLLLQTVLVIFRLRNLLQSVHDAAADFLHTALFVRFNAGQQLLDVVNLLGKFLLQCRPFLSTEVHQVLYGLTDSLACNNPLFVIQYLDLAFGQHVGHTDQRLHPVNTLQLILLGKNLQLVQIVLHQGRVDGRGQRRLIFLNPDREVHLTSQQFLRNKLANLHFLLPIKRSNACHQVQLFGVQRLDLDIDFLSFVDYESLPVACH